MPSFNVEKYVPTINSILRLSDLSTISAKRIRHALAREFPNDEIAVNKSILDKRILECFSKIREEREGSVSADENRTRGPPRPSQDLLKSDLLHPSSPPVPAPAPKRKPQLHSSPPLPPAKKTRPTSLHVKRDHYDSDEDAKFAAELDLALNSKPIRKTRGAGTRVKPRSKKIKNGGEEEDLRPKKKRAPNPNSAFHAPLLLSPQLADVVLDAELSRPMVVKKLWEYIKSNELQNPSNKTEIICDAKLQALFNVDKVHMFTMNKYLSNHMWSKADVVGGDSSTRKKPISNSLDSQLSPRQPSSKKNGKHVLSKAVAHSDGTEKSAGDVSDESRFSDSEDDD